MFQDKKILAIIPARGGSKGIPKKNIRAFCGKPLIAFSIANSLGSKYIDETRVSSDSEEILEIARGYGANVIKRPDELAQDTAKSIDAIKHAVQTLEKENLIFDYVILLQPTSPLITSHDIDMAIEQFAKEDNDIMIPVTKSHVPPDVLIEIKDGKVSFQNPKFISDGRRQNYSQYYAWCGAIFIYKKEILDKLETFSFIPGRTGAVVIPKYKSVEIDTLEDMFIAESILKNIKRYEDYQDTK